MASCRAQQPVHRRPAARRPPPPAPGPRRSGPRRSAGVMSSESSSVTVTPGASAATSTCAGPSSVAQVTSSHDDGSTSCTARLGAGELEAAVAGRARRPRRRRADRRRRAGHRPRRRRLARQQRRQDRLAQLVAAGASQRVGHDVGADERARAAAGRRACRRSARRRARRCPRRSRRRAPRARASSTSRARPPAGDRTPRTPSSFHAPSRTTRSGQASSMNRVETSSSARWSSVTPVSKRNPPSLDSVLGAHPRRWTPDLSGRAIIRVARAPRAPAPTVADGEVGRGRPTRRNACTGRPPRARSPARSSTRPSAPAGPR